MKIIVIGGVSSTQILVEKLHEHGFKDVHVFGYKPKNIEYTSGWVDLSRCKAAYGYGFTPFVKVADCADYIVGFQPDIIFAVGLSQLIPDEIIAIPRLGCIGFHPTCLPKGRGRAPIAWLVLEEEEGAASFFIISSGVDDGPLLVQKPFPIDSSDDASSVELKLLSAEATALDELLPEIMCNRIVPEEQEHDAATWYGRRSPEDGCIDWLLDNVTIQANIRASTLPHPGAFTYAADAKIRVWKATLVDMPFKGVPGRLLLVESNGHFIVQCGKGLLRVTDWDSEDGWHPKDGLKLGYYPDVEINHLRMKYAQLEIRLSQVERFLDLNPHLIIRSEKQK